MHRTILPQTFFSRSTLVVARELLGKYLVRKIANEATAYMITEVEAYVGSHDLACHTAKGKTDRTAVMFGPAGYWYVYLVYGMHYMLNVVTKKPGCGAAVLIRGVEGITGPGNVAKKLDVTKALYGAQISKKSGLWIEDRGVRISSHNITRTPRIGVAYAGPIWSNKPYRFMIKKSNTH